MVESLERARASIQEVLRQRPGGVFTEAELHALRSERREEWHLAKRVTTRAFIEFLVESLGLRIVQLKSEAYGHVIRYAWGEYSPFNMALSLRPRGYLSHGTAILLHGLNDQLPKTIYVNQEQSAKPRGHGLTQERLTLAFTRRQRTSNYIYAFGTHRAVILSGKQTGAWGVSQLIGPHGEALPVTGLARTLVDIAVRPAYAGGIQQTLEAYRGARGRVHGAAVVSALEHLDYVYPYHQAIGFLMERAGFGEEDLEPLARLGMQLDFYLLHGMRNPSLNSRWRLFVPQGI